MELDDGSNEGSVLVLFSGYGRNEAFLLKPANNPNIKEGSMRSRYNNWDVFQRKKVVSIYFRRNKAKTNPENESGKDVVKSLKNPSESRSWAGFIHSNETKFSKEPAEEYAGNEDDDSHREEGEATNNKENLVKECQFHFFLLKRGFETGVICRNFDDCVILCCYSILKIEVLFNGRS